MSIVMQTPPAVEQAAPATDDIIVTGVREGTIALDRLVSADEAFRRGKPTFAPQGRLRFVLRPRAGVALAGTTLTLRQRERTVPVPLDADGGFVLPVMDTAGAWELIHNRGRAPMAVRVEVFSPGTVDADRRLGDLRLQCRAAWEVKKGDMSFLARTAFGTMGGCGSSSFAFYLMYPRPIAQAVVEQGGTTRPLPLRADGTAFRAPLADKTLGNDARVKVRERE